MDVTALHGEYRGSSRALGIEVVAVVSLTGGCTSGSQSFWETPTAAREMAVQNWLTAVEDEGVLVATADQLLLEEDGGGDATQRGGSVASDGGDSDDSDGGGSDASDGEGSEVEDGGGSVESDGPGRNELFSGGGDDSATEASENAADS